MASAAIHGLLFAVWVDLTDSGVNAAVQQEPVLEIVSIEAIPEKPTMIATTSKSVSVENLAAKTPRQVTLKKPVTIQIQQPQTASDLPSKQILDAEKATVASSEAKPNFTATEPEQTVLEKAQNSHVQHEQTNSLVRNHLESFKFYPASARRRGIEGHVDVAFILTHNGAADQITVMQGSGYAMLDQAAVQTVARAQPFPADDGSYRFRLRFKRL